MPFSLSTVTIDTYLQFLPSIVNLINKAEEHCRANGLDDTALSTARLADDMWPFATQVSVASVHSLGALQGAMLGLFGTNVEPEAMRSQPTDFATLRSNAQATIQQIKALDRKEIDALVGKDMRVEFGDIKLEFLVEEFLLSFAMPNFFHHSSHAYGILRNQGLAIGKMDYIGQLRLKH